MTNAEQNPFDLDAEKSPFGNDWTEVNVVEFPTRLTAADADAGVEDQAATDAARLERMQKVAYERELANRLAREQVAAELSTSAAAAPDLVVADVDDMPQSLLGERATLEPEELTEAMKTRPVNLLDALRAARKGQKAVPTLLSVDGAGCVFYRGKSNSLSGQSGRGKSRLAKMAVLEEARAGRCALVIDREKDVEEFAEAMVDLGITDDEAARVFYWSPTKSTEALMPVILGFLRKYDIDLVVLDSVSRDISRWSSTASENSNDDVRRWYDASVDPIVRFGRTPLLIDHVGRPQTNAQGKQVESDSTYAKGAAAKREVITGTATMLRIVVEFSARKAGWAKLVAAKANAGGFAEGEVIAELHVTPGAERSTFALRASSEVVDATGEKVPTLLMERLSRWIISENAEGRHPSKDDALKLGSPGGGRKPKSDALNRLIDERYVRVETEARGKQACHSVRPYLEADDPRTAAKHRSTADTASAPSFPATGGGFGGSTRNVKPDLF